MDIRGFTGSPLGNYRWRCGSEVSGELSVATGEPGWPVAVRDVSLGGVGLLSPRPVEPGQQVVLELRRGAGVRVRAAARVAYVRAVPGAGHVVGCQLNEPLSERDVRALLNNPEAAR